MLRFVVRRLRVQRRMVAAVVALVTAATSLLGVASLLLGETEDRAFSAGIRRSQPHEVDVTAFLVEFGGSDLTAVRDVARDLVGAALAPMDPTVTSSASSWMRQLPDPGTDADRLGYLATVEALDERADLTSGRWPGAPTAPGAYEAVLPDSAASRLGLGLGDRLELGDEIGLGGVEQSVRLVVVGTFRPRAGWDGDPLSGAGFDPAYSAGSGTLPAYGPFVVDDAAFLASGSSVASMRVTAHPDLRLADDAALRGAVAALADASPLLAARVGDEVRITRVASGLPFTVGRLHAQQDTARSTVLVVLLLGTALSLACLVLAGRLVASVRDDERALLVALGLGRRQQLGVALVEAAGVALTAAAVAVPASAVAHTALTHLPAMRAAGLTQGPSVTGALLLTVVAGAVGMTLALVAPVLDLAPTARSVRWRPAARTGVDLLLLGVVAAAWWQLSSQPTSAGTSGDVTLVVAPVAFLLGLVLVVVRLVPLLLGIVARWSARTRSLVLPLAATQAARRPVAGAAMVLLAAASAAATFGVTLQATWDRSQEDQADVRVGTDVKLTIPGTATAEDAAAVAVATGSGTGRGAVSAVVERPLALGSYLGDVGSAPVLVAVDSRQADALLRGRLEDGRTWATVGAELTPGPAVEGLPVPADDTGFVLQGQAPADVSLTVTPTALVEDASGFRSAISAAPVPVDGRPHSLRWQSGLGGGRLVALGLQLSADPSPDLGAATADSLSIALRVPGVGAGATAAGWHVHATGRDSAVNGATISEESTGTGTELMITAEVDPNYLAYSGAELLAAAFEEPAVVPAVVSQQLAEAVDAEVGDEVSGIVGGTALPLKVTAIVPTIPSAPGRMAVLADADTLSRVLVHAGRLDPVVDGWWFADPDAGTVRALRALQLGDVTTRDDVAEQLARGPLRATVPAALLTLVVAATVLLLAGAGLVVGGDQRRRSAEVARLRALGLTRGDARRLLLAEHGALLGALVVLGALVGAAGGVALGPSLVRSDLGAAPVPSAVVVWPWAIEVALVGGLLLACLVITGLVTWARLRRSDMAPLRTGDS